MLSTALVLVLAAAGAFPIPAEKGLAIDPNATSLRLPHGLAQVERFYRAQFRDEPKVTLVRQGATLTIRSRRPGDAWSRAVL